MSYDPEKVEAALRGAALGEVSNEASNVPGSPFRYVYVYLTPDGVEGPHVVVSDLREWEDRDGILVGGYADGYVGEALDGCPAEVETIDEMLALARAYVERMAV